MRERHLATLSHELNTPLVSLKGFLQLMKEGRLEPDSFAEPIDICWRSLIKLEKHINRLLELALLEQTGEKCGMAEIDFAALLSGVIDELSVQQGPGEKSLSLYLEPGHDYRIMGNTNKLAVMLDLLFTQIFRNSEAVESVLDRSDRALTLTVSARGGNDLTDGLIRDFNQLYTSGEQGTCLLPKLGIRLSLLQQIVRLHKGRIEARALEGGGQLAVVLPLA